MLKMWKFGRYMFRLPLVFDHSTQHDLLLSSLASHSKGTQCHQVQHLHRHSEPALSASSSAHEHHIRCEFGGKKLKALAVPRVMVAPLKSKRSASLINGFPNGGIPWPFHAENLTAPLLDQARLSFGACCIKMHLNTVSTLYEQYLACEALPILQWWMIHSLAIHKARNTCSEVAMFFGSLL